MTPSEKLAIFLSYSSEDQSIADAAAKALRRAFGSGIKITMMSEFPAGLNWRDKINESTENTDILIAIATGRLRPSHSFTGFEIGSFTQSVRAQPRMKLFPEVMRRLIPFAILEKLPSAVNEFQGIAIKQEDLYDIRFEPSKIDDQIHKLTRNASDSATKKLFGFLGELQEIVSKTTSPPPADFPEQEARREILKEIAYEFCIEVLNEINNRVEKSITPESKVIITFNGESFNALLSDADGSALSKALIEIHGPCYDVFGIRGDTPLKLSWDEFTKYAEADTAYSWRETFKMLLTKTAESRFIDDVTITSFDRKKLFRLLISQMTSYYSGAREISIYVIELLRQKDYGDTHTTTLLKAMQLGLGFRFMFLEHKSQYSPLQIKYTLNRDLKQKLSLMQNSLNILVQIQDDYDLTNSSLIKELVGDFVGEEQLNKLNDQWEARRKGLSNSAQKIIQYDGDVSDSAFNGLRSEFLTQLGSLCEETRDMNKNYTAGVLKKLREIVEGETPQ